MTYEVSDHLLFSSGKTRNEEDKRAPTAGTQRTNVVFSCVSLSCASRLLQISPSQVHFGQRRRRCLRYDKCRSGAVLVVLKSRASLT
eukprot:scaffold878_cov271-Pinguiococcus_pyrenoidosus.AAC.56